MPLNRSYILTCIIPTFNREEQLKRAVESVINQRLNNCLIHIFDDHSTDGTEGYVRSLMRTHPEIRYTRREHNYGSLPNYLDALSTVDTPYYLSLADDDWYFEDSIQPLLNEALADPTLGAVISPTLHVTEAGEYGSPNPGANWDFRRYEPEEFLPLWLRRGHFQWSSIIFRTDAKNEIGGPDIAVDSVWDVDFQLRFFNHFPVKLISIPAAAYLIHEGQDSKRVSQSHISGLIILAMRAQALFKESTGKQPLSSALSEFLQKWITTTAHKAAASGGKIGIHYCMSELGRNKASFNNRIYFLSRFLKKKASITLINRSGRR